MTDVGLPLAAISISLPRHADVTAGELDRKRAAAALAHHSAIVACQRIITAARMRLTSTAFEKLVALLRLLSDGARRWDSGRRTRLIPRHEDVALVR